MPRQSVRLPRSQGELDLDIVSHGRGAPASGGRLSREEVAAISRTVKRIPEVVVKVSRGARDIGGARAHLAYIDRHGKLAVHTDEGQSLQGRAVAGSIVDDWNLDLCSAGRRPGAARDVKLVHNIVLSMPAHTPPEKLLAAAMTFARETFALQHRYAMVLHTDQGHPHVHLVVKAEREFEPGRLHITKPMLRAWRTEFAACLREHGVPANATVAAVRGRVGKPLRDPIHRRMEAARAWQALASDERGSVRRPKVSTFMQRKVQELARRLSEGRASDAMAVHKLAETRLTIVERWRRAADSLRGQGDLQLAQDVEAFLRKLPPVVTDEQRIVDALRETFGKQAVLDPTSGTAAVGIVREPIERG